MIKNIYDQKNKDYKHNYYCDNCFTRIIWGEILRHDKAIRQCVFDLCAKCYREFCEEEEREKNANK